MDAEKEILSILTVVGRSNLNYNQKKIVTDNLSILTAKFNALNEKCKKIEMRGVNMVGEYDSQLQKSVNLLNLLGYDEQTFCSVNDEFLRWMIESAPNQSYCGQLMNKYLLEGWQLAFMICKLEEDISWAKVRDCFLSPNKHIEKTAESKLMDIIDSIKPDLIKIKLYNQYLKK